MRSSLLTPLTYDAPSHQCACNTAAQQSNCVHVLAMCTTPHSLTRSPQFERGLRPSPISSPSHYVPSHCSQLTSSPPNHSVPAACNSIPGTCNAVSSVSPTMAHAFAVPVQGVVFHLRYAVCVAPSPASPLFSRAGIPPRASSVPFGVSHSTVVHGAPAAGDGGLSVPPAAPVPPPPSKGRS